MSSDNNETRRRAPHSFVTKGGPLNAERHETEIELQRLVHECEQQPEQEEENAATATTSFWSQLQQPIIGGINNQSLVEIVNRLNALPGCRVCAQLLADMRVLLLAIYTSQQRTLRIMENRLEEHEEAENSCCGWTFSFH